MVFNNHRRTVGKRRVLRTESLEERALLSAVPLTSGEYTDLTAKYSALELPGTADELNIITLDLSEGDGLTELRSAIAEAKKTPQSDLIVVRTTADANTITYTASGDRLEIAIDSSSYGSLAIVGFGDAPLTLDADQLGHHMYLRSSLMNISLANMTLTGGNFTNGSAIFNASKSLTITDCTITGNTASTSGGAIFSQGNGITIVDSVFSGNTASKNGGAICCTRGTCTIINSVFSENSAESGGSISADGSLIITDSVIRNNTASNIGGGIYNIADVEISNSRIYENTAYSGAGICNDGYCDITDSEISKNRASHKGGGIINASLADISLTNVRVAENYAEHISSTEKGLVYGGGIYNKGYAEILDCEIVSNIASCKITGEEELSSYVYGGGIYNDGNMTLTDSKVAKNIARYENQTLSEEMGAYGGGICNEGSLTAMNDTVTENLTDGQLGTSGGSQTLGLHTWGGGICTSEAFLFELENSVIAGNQANIGGGIYISENRESKITHATIAGNLAETGGGVWNDSLLYVYNTIVADNGTESADGRDIWTSDADSARAMLTNSLVSRAEHRTGTDFFHGGSFIGSAESPVSAGFADAANGDYRLSADSVAIDAGNDLLTLPETDADGTARLQGHHVDMGAYEFTQSEYVGTQETASTVVTTEKDIIDAYDGRISLREAVAYAENGDTITFDVAGNRVELYSILTIDKELTLSGTSPENKTVIDGMGITSLLNIEKNVGRVTLEALTLTNGMGRGLYINNGNNVAVIDLRIEKIDTDGNSGVAVHNVNSELSLLRTVVTQCGGDSGGVIYNYGEVLTITDCAISNNFAVGIHHEHGTLTVSNSEITENTHGGIFTFRGTASILNTAISRNTAPRNGAGIMCEYTTLSLCNTLVSENRVECTNTSSIDGRGGGICTRFADLTIINCTIAGNSVTRVGSTVMTAGGGIYNANQKTKIYNTIIAENEADVGRDVGVAYAAPSGNCNLSTYDGWDLESNYLYDPELPLFRDSENGDYRLSLNNTQAFDRGNNEWAAEAGMDETWTDLAGNMRFQNDSIDIGAYETGKTALGVPGWSVSVLGGDSVCVTLAGVPNASGYMIEYAANADLENAQTQTFTDSGALTISGIEADTEYFFRVKSIGTGEYADSKWSEAQSLTIQREAESLIVDTVLDVVDAYDGVTSIREAIALAKDGETVTFAESMRDQTIVLNGTPLELTKAVSLDADGLNVTLDGDFESTVLYVDPLSQTPFMLKGLTFIHGAGGLRFSPAGIEHEAGVLSVIDCVIARNDGAGIYSSADTLTVKNSQIIQNEGVGLYFSEGRGLMVMNSEISRNGWDGIYVLTNALTLLNSTVTGNKFNGVYAYNNMFTVNNSIVTANLNGWDLYGNAKAANSIIGKTNPQYRVSLKSTQTGVRDPGFAYLPDFANYEEWLDAREKDWDLSLTSGSSAIDRGDTKLFTKTGMPQTSSDGAGNARVFGKKVDIGAYEFHAAFVETPQAEVMRSGKKLTVTWDAVPGASSYLVEYRDVQTAKWTLRTVKKGTSLAINGKVGTTYEIRVAAVTAYGNSNADVETVTVYAPLTTPKLKALRDFCKDDTFSVEVTNYAFYLADTSESVTIGMNGKYESFAIENGYGRADLASGETVTFKDGIFTVTNAKSSSQYKMEVMFANPLTGSAFAKVNVRTTKTTYLAPTDLQVTAKTANSISLDWSDSPAKNDASKLAQKYTVQYSTNGGKSWRSVSVKTSDATLTRLKPGMYLIRVLAAKDSKFEASLPTEILEIVL